MKSLERRPDHLVAFRGATLIAEGDRGSVVRGIFREGGDRRQGAILIYDAVTSESVELDLRGSEQEVLARLEFAMTPQAAMPATPASTERRGPGRPRLGVVARELTLLPRHWEWLAAQPGGASAAVRRLIDLARAAGPSPRDARRVALESAYRFISAMAGDQARFEDATRALFALEEPAFDEASARWPRDVRAHSRRLAAAAFALR